MVNDIRALNRPIENILPHNDIAPTAPIENMTPIMDHRVKRQKANNREEEQATSRVSQFPRAWPGLVSKSSLG